MFFNTQQLIYWAQYYIYHEFKNKVRFKQFFLNLNLQQNIFKKNKIKFLFIYDHDSQLTLHRCAIYKPQTLCISLSWYQLLNHCIIFFILNTYILHLTRFSDFLNYLSLFVLWSNYYLLWKTIKRKSFWFLSTINQIWFAGFKLFVTV